MAVVYRLVGYDRKTERQAVRIDIPTRHVGYVKRTIGRDIIADHPLSPMQARDIAGVIGFSIDTNHYDYFIEPYGQPAQRQSA